MVHEFQAALRQLQGLREKERWLSFGESLAEGETVAKSAQRCAIANTTAFQWRHRFLDASRQDTEALCGIVEEDETYLVQSRKRERDGTDTKRRDGKGKKHTVSEDPVAVLSAADRSANACAPCGAGNVRNELLSQAGITYFALQKTRGNSHVYEGFC